VIDFHTGSARRANLPHIRGNYARPDVLAFARLFAPLSALHKPRERGTLRNAATAIGVPTVTFEAGAPGSLQEDAIAAGTATIERVMARLDMIAHAPAADHEQQAFFARSRWLRAPRGGLLLSDVTTGTWVAAGSEIGRVINPLTDDTTVLRAPYAGRVLGRALNQLVLPGLATFNIGIVGAAFDESRASTARRGGERRVVGE
jgi:predicted deacylase